VRRSTRALGRDGEALAATFLERRGYRIVARNLRIARGEIDLIAYDGAVLVFIEVKGRSGAAFGRGDEAVGARKRAQLGRLATAYLAQRRLSEQSCRFDLVTVDWSAATPRIDLIPNAFEA
jgi:putative endonuclease